MPKIRLHSVLVLICSEAERPLKFQGPHTKGGGRYFHIRSSGAWTSNQVLEAKFGARSGQVHQIREKNLRSSVTTRRKSWEKIPILGSNLKFRWQNLGYLSPVFLEAKIGAPTIILEANIEAKSPDLLIWKNPSPSLHSGFTRGGLHQRCVMNSQI